jgi:hypothetical protein
MAQRLAWPRYQRNTSAMLVLGIALGAFDLAGDRGGSQKARVSVQACRAGAQDAALQARALLRRDRIQAEGCALVELIELARARREQRAALEHLDLHAQLEHVGGGAIATSAMSRLRQHRAPRRRSGRTRRRPG